MAWTDRPVMEWFWYYTRVGRALDHWLYSRNLWGISFHGSYRIKPLSWNQCWHMTRHEYE